MTQYRKAKRQINALRKMNQRSNKRHDVAAIIPAAMYRRATAKARRLARA